jgi:hypothetical protein
VNATISSLASDQVAFPLIQLNLSVYSRATASCDFSRHASATCFKLPRLATIAHASALLLFGKQQIVSLAFRLDFEATLQFNRPVTFDRDFFFQIIIFLELIKATKQWTVNERINIV